MFKFLLIVQTIIAASLVGVILIQRSEGGGLGVGGSSSGFMTARGAADFLTRLTAVLGGVFILLSILLAGYAGVTAKPVTVDTSLVNQAAPISGVTPAPAPAPMPGVPAKSAAATKPIPAPAVPLAQ
jgi:preprotein translocase subunit SecG